MDIFGGAGKVVAKVAKTASGQNGKAAIMSQVSTPKAKSQMAAIMSPVAKVAKRRKLWRRDVRSHLATCGIHGHSERLRKSARAQIEKSKAFLQGLKFDEEFQGIVMMGDVEKSFLVAVTQKAQAVILEKNACREAKKNIKRSTFHVIFEPEFQELEYLIEKFFEVQAFLDFMRRPTQDLQASLQSFDAVLEMGFIVSKPYLLRALDASVKYKMLFSVRSS